MALESQSAGDWTTPLDCREVEMIPHVQGEHAQFLFALTFEGRNLTCNREVLSNHLLITECISQEPQFSIKGAEGESEQIEVLSANEDTVGVISRNTATIFLGNWGTEWKLIFQRHDNIVKNQAGPGYRVFVPPDNEIIGCIYFKDGLVKFHIPRARNWANPMMISFAINHALTTYKERIFGNSAIKYPHVDQCFGPRPELKPIQKVVRLEMRPNFPENRDSELFLLVGKYTMMTCKKENGHLYLLNTSNQTFTFTLPVTTSEDEVIFAMSSSGDVMGSVLFHEVFFEDNVTDSNAPDYRFNHVEPDECEALTVQHKYDMVRLADDVVVGKIIFENGLVVFLFNHVPIWAKAVMIAYGMNLALASHKSMVMDNMQPAEKYAEAAAMYYRANEDDELSCDDQDESNNVKEWEEIPREAKQLYDEERQEDPGQEEQWGNEPTPEEQLGQEPRQETQWEAEPEQGEQWRDEPGQEEQWRDEPRHEEQWGDEPREDAPRVDEPFGHEAQDLELERPLQNSPLIEMRPNYPENREAKVFLIVGQNDVMVCKKSDEVFNISDIMTNIIEFCITEPNPTDYAIAALAPSGEVIGAVADNKIYYQEIALDEEPVYKLQYQEPLKALPTQHNYQVMKIVGNNMVGYIHFENGLVTFQFNNAPLWLKQVMISYGIAKSLTTYKNMVMDNLQPPEKYDEALEMYANAHSALEPPMTYDAPLPPMGNIILRGALRRSSKNVYLLTLMDERDCKILLLAEINERLNTCQVTDPCGNYIFDATGFDRHERKVKVKVRTEDVGLLDLNVKKDAVFMFRGAHVPRDYVSGKRGPESDGRDRYTVVSGDKCLANINNEDRQSAWRICLDPNMDKETKILILAYILKLGTSRRLMSNEVPENIGFDVRCQCLSCVTLVNILPVHNVLDHVKSVNIRGTCYNKNTGVRYFDVYDEATHKVLINIELTADTNTKGHAAFKSLGGNLIFEAAGICSTGTLLVQWADGTNIGHYQCEKFFDKQNQQIMQFKKQQNTYYNTDILSCDRNRPIYGFRTYAPIMKLNQKSNASPEWKALILAFIMRLAVEVAGINQALPAVDYGGTGRTGTEITHLRIL